VISDQPVQLYDAYSGVVRATYRPFNALDEMESPSVVEFSNDGQKMLCGGFRSDRTIHLFDTAMPGRDSTILRLGKTRRSSDGQKGLVSAACFGGQSGGPNKQFFAVGTYSPGSIYIYDYRAGQQATGTILSGLCVVGHGKGHSNKKRRFTGAADCNSSSTAPIADETGGGAKDDINWFSTAKIKWFSSRTQSGVTQLSFAKSDEYTLYSASRRSNAIIAWDLRMLSDNADYQSNPVRGIGSYETSSDTNQRLEFDIDESGRMLFVGCQDNCVRVYDLAVGKLLATVDDLGEVANGVSHAVVNGRSLLAIATGSRRFLSEDGLEHDDEPSTSIDQLSCLRLNDVSELYPVGPEAES
jgi:WD40 repeat protein